MYSLAELCLSNWQYEEYFQGLDSLSKNFDLQKTIEIAQIDKVQKLFNAAQ